MGDLTTPNSANSDSVANNASAQQRSTRHDTSNSRVSWSNKTSSNNSRMDGSHKSVSSKTSQSKSIYMTDAKTAKSETSNTKPSYKPMPSIKASPNNSRVNSSHKARPNPAKTKAT